MPAAEPIKRRAPHRDDGDAPVAADHPAAGHRVHPPSTSTRVTVGFPFSTIRISEPNDVVVELAELVARLARAEAHGASTTTFGALAAEADALLERIRHSG